MSPVIWGAIITSGTTLIVGVFITLLGSRKLEAIKSELTVQSQHKLEFLKRKREVYEDLCRGIQFIIGGRLNTVEEVNEHKKLAFETYDMLSLWASDNVCEAADNLFRSIRLLEPEVVQKECFQNLLTAMRNDLTEDESDYVRDYQFIS